MADQNQMLADDEETEAVRIPFEPPLNLIKADQTSSVAVHERSEADRVLSVADRCFSDPPDEEMLAVHIEIEPPRSLSDPPQ